ncbi:MAG: NTP transferase domain-containing protein [Frankiaceae bacterium]|nr:NTP transferase domain-containing protein [Frankiaceae bacterium]
MTLRSYDAIVLAGGASRRMGVATDKTAIALAGRPMLDYVLDAVAAAGRIVVVGEPRPTTLPVQWCREEPSGGGPAAAIAAALPLVTADVVAVVAGDQPLLSADAVAEVVGAVVADGAVGVDGDGRPQWLLGAWRTSALRRTALVSGASLRDTLGSLAWTGVALPAGVAADCDTPDDVRRASALLSERSLRA